MRIWICGLVSGLAALAVAGCASEDWGPDEMLSGGSRLEQAVLAKGKTSYLTYCVGCHGDKGDGNGPAARFLDPKPRDLRKGRVKFAAVTSGGLPRDEDLARTLQHGLSGTSMPSWALIPADERAALVTYIKTFHEGYAKKGAGTGIAIPADPWRKDPAAGIAEGERVYHAFAACSSCHPAYVPRERIRAHLTSFNLPIDGVRPDAFVAVAKDSEWGAPITPPDFLVDRVKTGPHRAELILVIAAGVHGTAMPSWAASLSKEQLWGLAYYVESLASRRGTPAATALKRELENSERTATP